MSRTAVVRWVHNFGDVADNRFRDHHLLHWRVSPSPTNLHTKSQRFVLLINYCGAIHRRESADSVYGFAK